MTVFSYFGLVTLQPESSHAFVAAVYEHRPNILGLLTLSRQTISRDLDKYEDAVKSASLQVSWDMLHLFEFYRDYMNASMCDIQ